MDNKRKRGANYTPQETKILLELVNQFNYAIEDKRTASIYLAHKKEAWEKVCAAYNAVATTGIRSVEQLKVFYDNTKQKARKKLAKNGESSKLGDGSCCPAVTDYNLKILNLVKDQVTPVPNCCDNAALHFREHIKNHNNANVTCTPLKIINRRHKLNKKVAPKVKTKINYKELYFKTKSQNVYLERRKIYQDIRLRQKEHNLIVNEHNMKIKFMEEEHRLKMNTMKKY